VSAKYKGAFCEAKVRSVVKQVKVRVTFRNGLGMTTLSSEYVRSEMPLQVGATVTARHPDKQEYVEATVNKILDQSQYTVVFDDGDITQLRRNALCMKSGKHFSASESLGTCCPRCDTRESIYLSISLYLPGSRTTCLSKQTISITW
jgi:Ras-related protein Rab-1A